MASSLLSLTLPKPNITKATATTTSPPSAESLEHKFGGKGIKFSDSGDVELTVRNGSSLKLQIPNAHVTSYKPKVYWKDNGFEEVLYTLPPKASGPTSSNNARGGIGLVINNNNNNVAAGKNSKGLASPVDISQRIVKDVDDSDSIDAL